ncbi:MAG: universal stress protein, partial [Myxococcota bacterium]
RPDPAVLRDGAGRTDMPTADPTSAPLRRIVLATDLSADSVDLFAHALALVVRARAELFLLHVADGEHPEATWRRLPTVRTLLERWGVLPTSATPEQFEALGIRVHPVDAVPTDGDLPTAVARRVLELHPDLLVLGTHARSGFERLASPSIAEPVIRDVHKATLLVSDRARGLVDPETGRIRASRVLVPITSSVPQQPLVDELTRLMEAIGAGPVAFTFVHIGSDATLPTLTLPPRADWMWKTDRRQGSVVEQILEAEIAHDADLIAMATHGEHSFLSTIRGSTTERVLRRAKCPVFAVPV